ncbi:hypothetical protein V6N13_054474 [Hibiscus sabdariffa]
MVRCCWVPLGAKFGSKYGGQFPLRFFGEVAGDDEDQFPSKLEFVQLLLVNNLVQRLWNWWLLFVEGVD